MSEPDTHTQPADDAMADVAAALMACYNPAPPPAVAPIVNPWADETPVQGPTLNSLHAAFNG